MKRMYSIPKLVKYPELSKTWYVYFRYKRPDGTFEVKKFTGDINKDFNDHKSREAAGNALAKVTLQRLENGWNPLITEITEVKAEKYCILDALNIAIERKKKTVAAITYKNYSNTLKFVVNAVNSLNLASIPISDVKRVHLKKILEVISEERDWSGKAYNKALTHLQSLFTELLQWDIIEHSPADKMRKMPEDESEDKVYMTYRQRKTFYNHLSDKDPNFLSFCMMIYHSGIRPVEITRLRMNMIDMKRKMIFIPVGMGKKRTKRRKVAMTQEMCSFLAPIMALDYPEDYFLYGSSRIPGRGNEGKFKDFIPGPTQLKRDTSTKRWHRLVKEGLGIEMNMYLLKDMGANDKMLAGVEPEVIQSQFGHSELRTTKIYMTVADEIGYKTIQEKSPNFLATA